MRRGYTLVEIMVAIAILILGLLPIIVALQKAVATVEESVTVTVATQLARERMNEVWDLVGPTSNFYPGGVPFDIEGGARAGTAIPTTVDPEMSSRIALFLGGGINPGTWSSGQDFGGGDSRTGEREPAVPMAAADYGCTLAEAADVVFNDNLHVCLDPTDPNGSALYPSDEKYRIAMAVLAARLDPLDALAHYMGPLGYHPDPFPLPCSAAEEGACPKIDGIEEFGDIVDKGVLSIRNAFECFTRDSVPNSRNGVPWWDFGYLADGDDPDDTDDLPAAGYADDYWRFVVPAAHGASQNTNGGLPECTDLVVASLVAQDIDRSRETYRKFRRDTQMSTVYFPADAHDPPDQIDALDARYYRSSSGILGRLVRVAVAWRSGKGCPTDEAGGTFVNRCGDPTNPLRVSLGLPERVADLFKEVELRAFIPDPDQDPCDPEPYGTTPTTRTNRLGRADWDGDPAFQHEECWHIEGL